MGGPAVLNVGWQSMTQASLRTCGADLVASGYERVPRCPFVCVWWWPCLHVPGVNSPPMPCGLALSPCHLLATAWVWPHAIALCHGHAVPLAVCQLPEGSCHPPDLSMSGSDACPTWRERGREGVSSPSRHNGGRLSADDPLVRQEVGLHLPPIQTTCFPTLAIWQAKHPPKMPLLWSCLLPPREHLHVCQQIRSGSRKRKGKGT